MPKLLRTQAEVVDASMEDLVHTHNELRGERIGGFESLAVARTRVRMDILAAENEVGKLGVPAGTRPVAQTVRELGFNPYKEGTMSHRLHNEIAAQTPITPRPTKAELPPEQRAARLVIARVRATMVGTSRLQAGSIRAQVLKFIQDAPERTATVAELEAHFQQPVRGYLQKLLEKAHIEVLPGEGA